MNEVLLKVNGINYGGWTAVRISRSMESIAGSFELSVTDRWSRDIAPRPIKKGDACTVSVNGQIVITGYVDDRNVSYDKASHTITILGRDKTGDLVDCLLAPKTYKHQSLKQICTDICKPFGIDVIVATDMGDVFKNFSIESNESGFEAISRAAAHRGVLLVSDGLGNLIITRASGKLAPSELVFSENIESCNATSSQRDQFSEYIVRNSVAGDDFSFGESVAAAKAVCRDASVKRFRPCNLHADEGADLQKRANHERNVRAGKANRLTYIVSSWLADGHELWQMNTLTPVTDPNQEPKLKRARLLITGLTMFRDENGSGCDIIVMAPGAFNVLAVPDESGETAW